MKWMEARTLMSSCGVTSLVMIVALGVACRAKEFAGRSGSGSSSDVSTQTDPDRAFWKWFRQEAPALSNVSCLEAMGRIQRELEKQHHGVFAEIGTDGPGRTLVLTADGDRHQFSMIERLFAARPEIAGWKLVAFRPREAKPFSTISIDNRDLAPATLRYVGRRSKDKLDIKLYVPSYADGDKVLGMMAFLALDHTLGEYDVETKLGGIELLPIAQAPASSRPLDQLPVEVDALRAAP